MQKVRAWSDRLYFLSTFYFIYTTMLNIVMICGIVFLFHKRIIERDYQDFWYIEVIIPILLLLDQLFISYVTKCPFNFVFICQWFILTFYLILQIKLKSTPDKKEYEILEIILVFISMVTMILKSIFTLRSILDN